MKKEKLCKYCHCGAGDQYSEAMLSKFEKKMIEFLEKQHGLAFLIVWLIFLIGCLSLYLISYNFVFGRH